jgi:DNA processing protein
MITSDRRARMLLSCAVECGDPAVAELVQNLGAEGAWAKIIEGVLGEPVAQRAAQVRVEVFERLAEAAAARFVVPGDDEWPSGLDDLRHAESIQRRGGEPFGLWLRGPGHLAHLMDRSVAIVGSRAATAYGNGIAADLAADLVEQGVTVLSGGAFGIDVPSRLQPSFAGLRSEAGRVTWERQHATFSARSGSANSGGSPSRMSICILARCTVRAHECGDQR